jgi:hypothetical protein
MALGEKVPGVGRTSELAEGASETHKRYVRTHEVQQAGGSVGVKTTPSLVLATRSDQDASSVLGGGDVTGGDPALVGKV